MVTGYPNLTTDTPGVRLAHLILVDRGECCPILIGPDNMACPCDGMYDLIEDMGEKFSDDFEWSVLQSPITEFGVIREANGIRYLFAKEPIPCV